MTVPATTRYLPLRSGPLTLLWDRQTGALRNINVGAHYVWRELVVLVRDDQWQTIPAQLTLLEEMVREDAFRLRFACRQTHAPLDFCWEGIIVGDSAGTLTYSFHGTAESTFAANRIGFCLLHPCEAAGQAVRQTRSDGTTVDGYFPMLIEPQIISQPTIGDLTALAHHVASDCWGEAQFTGEIFEWEDQRNWSDASFKTYGTPLSRPRPTTFRAGDERTQQVHLQLRGVESLPRAEASEPPLIRSVTHATPQPLPQFGICLSAADISAPPGSLARLCEALGASYVRWDCRLLANDGEPSRAEQQLLAALTRAQEANCRMELALHLPPDGTGELAALADLLRSQRDKLLRVLVFRQGVWTTQRDDVRALRRALANCDVPIGGGSEANFCEWNTEQALGNFPLAEVDLLSWSINPQVHATDDLSLLETPRSLAAQVATARAAAGNKPLVVSPITLLPRFNAVGTDINEPHHDPRQQMSIGAAWSIATWHALAAAGVAGTTWFEAFGARGFLDNNGELYPVGRCFRALARCRARTVERLQTPDSLSAVLLHGEEAAHLSLVNLTDREIVARWTDEAIFLKPHAVELRTTTQCDEDTSQ